jgi:hypothetical protein
MQEARQAAWPLAASPLPSAQGPQASVVAVHLPPPGPLPIAGTHPRHAEPHAQVVIISDSDDDAPSTRVVYEGSAAAGRGMHAAGQGVPRAAAGTQSGATRSRIGEGLGGGVGVSGNTHGLHPITPGDDDGTMDWAAGSDPGSADVADGGYVSDLELDGGEVLAMTPACLPEWGSTGGAAASGDAGDAAEGGVLNSVGAFELLLSVRQAERVCNVAALLSRGMSRAGQGEPQWLEVRFLCALAQSNQSHRVHEAQCVQKRHAPVRSHLIRLPF